MLECAQPSGLVFPVERRFAESRTDPNRQALFGESLGDPSASLAVAAEDQRHFVFLCTRRHKFLSLHLKWIGNVQYRHLSVMRYLNRSLIHSAG